MKKKTSKSLSKAQDGQTVKRNFSTPIGSTKEKSYVPTGYQGNVQKRTLTSKSGNKDRSVIRTSFSPDGKVDSSTEYNYKTGIGQQFDYMKEKHKLKKAIKQGNVATSKKGGSVKKKK
jgi:hypothetical protein